MIRNKVILSDNAGNELRMSNVNEFDSTIHFKNYAVKYVITGEENYTINQKKHLVKRGEFIAGNEHTFSSILIDSKESVKGICVDICQEKIQEVLQFNFTDSDGFEKFLFSDELLIKKFSNQNSSLGLVFEKIGEEYDSIIETPNLLSSDLFYLIAECIVDDQRKIFNHYSKLNFSKQETNKRLLDFIYSAKDFIDLNFQDKITINQIAASANLSEYHFIRLFKKIFNQTPHQYIIKKRLEFSKQLLLDNFTINEVAYQCGFSDLYSFTKSFKNAFGSTPSFYRKQISSF